MDGWQSVAHGFVVPQYESTHSKSHLLHMSKKKSDESQTPSSSIVREKLQSLLSSLDSTTRNTSSQEDATTTVVHLLGTGITGSLLDMPLSSLALLSQADVVLYDNLSLPKEDIQVLVKSTCVLQSVGKRGGDPNNNVLQSEIDPLLVKYAQNLPPGSSIVRLKGGDPLLFGRARTEVDALRDSGTHYTITPGLSSCIAGPHFAGIPLTDPVLNSQSFAVFSGTRADKTGLGEDGQREWANLQVDALVFLMIGQLPKLKALCDCLVDSGGDQWTGTTPCAVIQNAGRSQQQKVFRGTLHTLVDQIQEELGEEAATVSPAVLVVGQVAALDLLGAA